MLLLVLAATGIAEWTGLLGAIDARMEQAAYALRGPRTSQHSAVLVAIDDETTGAWGPAPWPRERWDRLVARVEQSGSRVVFGVAGVERVFSGMPENTHQNIVALHSGQEPFVRAVHVPATVKGAPGFLRKTASSACLPSESLTVNYVGTRAYLPAVSAHGLAAGLIPSHALADKVVIIGVTMSQVTGQVPTPVGWLTEPEIITHAAATAIDGACVTRRHPAHGIVLVVVAALLGLGLGTRLPDALGLVLVAMVTGLVGVLYASGFVLLWFDFAPTAPVLSLLLGYAFSHAHERSLARRALRGLARGLTVEPSGKSHRAPHDAQLPALAAAIELYLDGVHSSFVGTFDGLSSPIVLTPICSAVLDDVMEPSRDPRKDPFREAAVARQIAWIVGFMRDPALRTLIVPIVGPRGVSALWFINYTSDSFSDPLQRPLVERMAQRLAVWVLGDDGPTSPRRGMPTLLRDVAVVEANLRERLDHVQRSADVADHLPVAIFVASEWAEITWMNRQAQQLCGSDGNTTDHGLASVLASVMSIPESEVRDALRRAVALGLDSRLVGAIRTSATHPVAYEILISMSESVGGATGRSITAMAVEVETNVELGPSPPRATTTSTFDIRGVVLAALGDARQRTTAEVSRMVCLDFDDPMPHALGDLALFRDAIASLVADLLSNGDGSSPLLVTANPVGDRIQVGFADSTIPLPRASLEALLFAEDGFDAGGLARAIQLLKTEGVRVEVEGAAGSGATIQLMIPQAEGGDHR